MNRRSFITRLGATGISAAMASPSLSAETPGPAKASAAIGEKPLVYRDAPAVYAPTPERGDGDLAGAGIFRGVGGVRGEGIFRSGADCARRWGSNALPVAWFRLVLLPIGARNQPRTGRSLLPELHPPHGKSRHRPDHRRPVGSRRIYRRRVAIHKRLLPMAALALAGPGVSALNEGDAMAAEIPVGPGRVIKLLRFMCSSTIFAILANAARSLTGLSYRPARPGSLAAKRIDISPGKLNLAPLCGQQRLSDMSCKPFLVKLFTDTDVVGADFPVEDRIPAPERLPHDRHVAPRGNTDFRQPVKRGNPLPDPVHRLAQP